MHLPIIRKSKSTKALNHAASTNTLTLFLLDVYSLYIAYELETLNCKITWQPN